ncbi:hypothetical protein BDW02DRAFT_246625 [Decorospora gaudefroyi]|uniref:Uncharacterized protein n=1 Tax=Decorospora gaudefroyi TaxID=184978 RepID=A0A6A5JWT7_9PLEO|nr:hypothetical protein BDW02DRAFT_246625 [Decorospora gaudefroyi]
MEPPSRSQHPPEQREGGRFHEAQIHQEGSRFGPTHVTGGSVKQGNFVNHTYSERTLPAAKFDLTLALRRLLRNDPHGLCRPLCACCARAC